MEIKAKLDKPYSDKQRADFIVQYNHKYGYEIRETETALEAWGLDADELLEQKKQQVRSVRNSYLEKYVDPKQLVLVWETLTEDEQLEYKNYRQYLLDYTKLESWWEQNPDTFYEWKYKGAATKNEIEVI